MSVIIGNDISALAVRGYVMPKIAPQRLLSIVVPCHNESENLERLHSELTAVIDPLAHNFEIILVDDGSTDHTVAIARQLENRDERVRRIELVRNFGKEIAITAGLAAAHGDAAITIDADLQHPPALIPLLIEEWERGAEVVIGLRKESKSYAPTFKRWGSMAFHTIMKRLSDTDIRRGATDYRLLDRGVINEFNRFTERNRLTRGLIDWLGFRRAYVAFVPGRRKYGEAAYSYFKLFRLAMNSFITLSMLPLRLAGYLGMFITFFSGIAGIFIIIERYILDDPLRLHFSGPAVLGVFTLFLVGIILISLGLIALYIGIIHTEVMNRPLYVTRRTHRGTTQLADNIELTEEFKAGARRG
jgi:glycosyltransferase involved in cell wall biosynthesis